MMWIDWERDCPNVTRVARAIIRGSKATGRGIRTTGRGIRIAFKYCWKPALGLFIILAAAHGLATYILGKKVEAEIAKIKARGEFVSCAELGGPKIPDSENGALLYEKAYKQLEKMVPDVIGPYRNIAYEKILDSEKRDAKAWASVMDVPSKFQPVFTLIEQGAAKPKCRFNINWSNGMQAGFADAPQTQALSRLLAARALVYAKQGTGEDALHSIDLCFKLSDSIKDNPTLIHQLYRTAIVYYAANALRDTANMCKIEDSPRLHQLSDRLAGMRPGDRFYRAAQGERACGLWTYDDILKRGTYLDELLGLGNVELSRGLRFKITYIGRPFFYADELFYLRTMAHDIKVFTKPCSKLPKTFPKYDDVHEYDSIADIIMPYFGQPRMRVERGQVQVDCSRIFLALLAYKSDYGKYPASLLELKDKMKWKLKTQDPFSSNNFIYKPQGKGFLLYSIGSNFKDDGGIPAKDTKESQGDIVWKMDH